MTPTFGFLFHLLLFLYSIVSFFVLYSPTLDNSVLFDYESPVHWLLSRKQILLPLTPIAVLINQHASDRHPFVRPLLISILLCKFTLNVPLSFLFFFYTVSLKFIISWRQISARDRISFLLFGNPVFVKARQNESRWPPTLPDSLHLRRRKLTGCYSCRSQWDTWDIIQFWHEHFMPTSNGPIICFDFIHDCYFSSSTK